MISVVVLSKNEEENISDCLETVSWCDELIIIDDNSEDRTLEVAQNINPKLKIYKRSLDGDFSAQRNFGLSKAKGDWIFFVDADERVSVNLKNEIVYLISTHDRAIKLNGYFIKRRDIMWSKELKHGETGNIKLLRLARKGVGGWQGKVHEEWKIRGETGNLENPIYHYPHQTISEFLKEINLYTDIRSKELFKTGINVYWSSIILYPLAKFGLNYFLRQGFQDFLPGLIFATLMSFHSFLVRGKLWLLWRKK